MSVQAIRLRPIPPQAAARVLDVAAFGSGVVVCICVGYQGEHDWRFRYALAFSSPTLEIERFVWLDSLPHDGAMSSGWAEGNFRVATGPGSLLGVTNKTGRGLWLRAGPNTLELLAVHDAKGPQLPATPAWNDHGDWMGVAPRRSSAGNHVACSELIAAHADDDLPTTWGPAAAFEPTLAASRLHHPWVHQVTSLPDGRWLVGISTDGSTKSAYPSKSIGFRYAIVDSDGREVGLVDHTAAATQAPVNVYENVGDAIFPSSYHPFYPMHFDAKHDRLLHKLRNQLVVFDRAGKWLGSVDFAAKGNGLAGLKPFLLRAMLPSGHAVFVHEADRSLWSVELGPLDSLAARCKVELEKYRREIKGLGGTPLPIAELDGVEPQTL